MLNRFQRSWDLAGECMSLLLEDKSLLVFPLLSAIALVVTIASFAVPLIPVFAALSRYGATQSLGAATYVTVFVFYWLQFSIVIFFNTALVEVALQRLDGEEANVGDGLRRAFSLLPVILAYALIAATVGLVLRAIVERVGLIGRIIVGLIGFAWSVGTALVVPVLAAEDVGPLEAIGRSVELIKKAWGEDIIGNAGIGVVFGLLIFVTTLVGAFLVTVAFGAHNTAAAILLLVLGVLAVSLLGLAYSTLHGIYSAALYRFANGDPASGNIDQRLLENAFTARA
ncbi:MAG TPA: DUF6159 family protein [Casimicrobiaceae bacterium]|nr:DUF6159 family protein [Casimicrobiaceae bacterium]